MIYKYLDQFGAGWKELGSDFFYYEGGDAFIAGLVQMAQSISEVTCELCGEQGILRSDRHWIRTLCDKCELKEQIKEEKKNVH